MFNIFVSLTENTSDAIFYIGLVIIDNSNNRNFHFDSFEFLVLGFELVVEVVFTIEVNILIRLSASSTSGTSISLLRNPPSLCVNIAETPSCDKLE